MRRATLAVLSALAPAAAAAQVNVALSGAVSSDLRYRAQEERVHDDASGELLLDKTFERNENRVSTRLTLAIGHKAQGVGEVEFVWLGFSDVGRLDDLTLAERVDPFWIEAHAAYLEVYDLLPALDLRVGRQVVQWGTADQFNPTHNLNALDLYDPLRFGLLMPNQMVRADWHPRDLFTLTAAWVPVFRPARLPPTAVIGLRSTERIPIQDAEFRHSVAALSGLAPPGELDVRPVLPEATLDNSQAGARLATRLGLFDVSGSYTIGRDDMPQPYLSDGRDAPGETRVRLMYPRVQVVGADLAASLPWLADLGVWAEGAVFFPQRVTMSVLTPQGEAKVNPDGGFCSNDPLVLLVAPSQGVNAAECRPGARDPLIVDDEPFVRWTVGTDYSLTSQLYANAQWVHGFVDEFGVGQDVRVAASRPEDEHTLRRQGDYVVAGVDHRSFSDTLLLRVFGIAGLRDPRSYVVFPQVVWSVADGAELTLGAFVMLGDFDSKFGDPAAGGTVVFTKAKVYF